MCGKPHLPVTDRDSRCTETVYCDIGKRKVTCVKMTQSQIKKWKKAGFKFDE